MRPCGVSEAKMQAMTAVLKDKKAILLTILVCGIVECLAGLLSVIIWSVMMAKAVSFGKTEGVMSCAGIWGGLCAMLTSVPCILAGIPSMKTTIRLHAVFWLLGTHIATAVIGGQYLRYAVTAFLGCNTSGSAYLGFCYADPDLMVSLSALCLALSALMIVIAIIVIALYSAIVCKAGRAIDCQQNARWKNRGGNPQVNTVADPAYGGQPEPAGFQPPPPYPGPPAYGESVKAAPY